MVSTETSLIEEKYINLVFWIYNYDNNNNKIFFPASHWYFHSKTKMFNITPLEQILIKAKTLTKKICQIIL